MRNLLKVMTGVALALPLTLQAAEPAKGPTLADVLGNSGIALSGTVDASYDWSDVDGGPALRQFDVGNNDFSLHQVNLTVAKQPAAGFGALVNAVMGDDAAIIRGDGGADGDVTDLDVTQAFVQYACPGLTLMGGRFVTLAGMEVINPAGNLNASRSLLFFNQPLVHTGVRATVKIGDVLALTGGLVNSANGNTFGPFFLGKRDNNDSKTIEAQIAFTPSSAFSTFLTGYSGDEDAAATGKGTLRYDVVDLVLNMNLTDALYFGVNGDYFQQETGVGGTHMVGRGVAGYLSLKIGMFRISPRVEYLDFDTDATGVATENTTWLREATLTLGFAPASEVEFLAEVRNDELDDANGALTLPSRDAAFPTNDDQYTGTLKVIYKF